MITSHRIASLNRTLVFTGLSLCMALACSSADSVPSRPGGSGGNGSDGGSAPTATTNGGVVLTTTGGGLGPVTMEPPTMNCGDGVLDDDEACDDGNKDSGDGCGSNCRYLEPGYVCPDAGQPCRQIAKCGDGIAVFPEQCDDGGLVDGDGCSDICKFEIGFKCSGSPSTCTPTTCGDAMPEGAETCDDSNALPFDGCSERCQGEPLCTENGCTSTCGDGLKIGTEECDDGNAINSDGCSSTCTIEPGYICEQAPPCPDGQTECPMNLPIVFRDFNVDHPDFQAPDPSGTASENRPCDGYAPGIAQTTLDANGKPVFASAPAKSCVSAEGFAQWYVDSDVSSTILGNIILYPNGDGGYVNRFGPNGEQYITSVKTDDEQGAGDTLAACEESCVSRARDAQPPFSQADGPLRCTENEYCNAETTAARNIRDGALNQANNELMQAENENPPDEERIAAAEEAVAAAEAELAEAEAAIQTCLGDCETQLAERAAVCAAQCAPCSSGTGYCIGGEQIALDGDPLFFPIDDVPGAMDDTRYAARIPAQIYMGLGWPWETTSCGLEAECPNGAPHNFQFTSEIAYWFEFTDGMAADLTFIGDDDVWVFVNRRLVLDLGGIHVPLGGQFTINANGSITTRTWQANDPGVNDGETELESGMTSVGDLGLQPGNVYEIKVFHAERKPEGSSFQLTLSGFHAARSECHSICGDGILAAGEQCDLGEELNVGGHDGCNADCTLGAYCGDGIVQVDDGEECDDADPSKPANCAGCRIIDIK